VKRSELKQLIREVVEEVSSNKFIAFKNHKGEWKIYQLGRNPNAKDWYVDVEDTTLNSGFQSEKVEKYPHNFLRGSSVSDLKKQIADKENEHKKGDIDIINGETIIAIEGSVGDKGLRLKCKSGNSYDIDVDDDGPQNDSNAYISAIDMGKVMGRQIVDAQHADKDNEGVVLKFMTKRLQLGTITIQHDHNGYYGFSYSVTKRVL
jgi:hypothetical protein